MKQPDAVLRDRFAEKALGWFHMDDVDVYKLVQGRELPRHDLVARFCYDLADAMLAARKKGSKGAK